MLKRALTLGFIAVLAVILAGSTSIKPGMADSGYSLQGQGQGAEKRHDNGEFLALLDVAGVIFTDGQGDVVTVGVHRSEQCNGVTEKGKQLGIGSLVCIETSPIEPVVTLSDRIRPVEGGLQIQFVKYPWLYTCTLGFNAIRAAVPGFVVNSHCSGTQGTAEGIIYHQPTWSGNRIGVEIADPKFFTGEICPKGKQCRYSDSAYAQRDSAVTADLGLIARPDTVNTGSLTLTTDPIPGRFWVVSEAPPKPNSNVGSDAVTDDPITTNVNEATVLNKVGRTTGWTQGPVTRTCVHTGVSGTKIVLLCQDFVRAGVAGGDSGSPVFKITSGDDVRLYGILWGGGGDEFVYSPIANIEKDLGSLTTY